MNLNERVKSTPESGDATFGFAAASVGVALTWFAIWTITCNGLVLASFHYRAFLYGLLVPTVTCAIITPYFFYKVASIYRQQALDKPTSQSGFSPILVAAVAAAALAAIITQRTTSPIPYILGNIVSSLFIWRLCSPKREQKPLRLVEVGWRLPTLIGLLIVIYYFSHHADLDDANYINLAVGAQRTAGPVFQLDTMLGDGPGPIHLPTYKFHAFELLGATISSIFGFEPIAVFHLILPLFQLGLLALILLLTLAPIAGGDWLAAALLWIAFLFLNEGTLASWGIHGVIRLFQGKAFLVSALVPLIGALTVRWFCRGQRIDLLGLGLANVCAIGFSANGLYGAPLASGFVTAAFIAAAPNSRLVWRRAIGLLPTIIYPFLVAAVILFFGLALPSEVKETTNAVGALCFVASFGLAGHLVLTLLALGGIGFANTAIARAAIIYPPLSMFLILNPFSWHIISVVTGNLGFRIFWSLPAASIAALIVLSLIRQLGVRSEKSLLAISFLALVGAVLWNNRTSGPLTGITWHTPDLKVVRPDYDLARRLALRTNVGCRILAPERVSSWLSAIRDMPYPVFVRELYLIHYRFTMDATERALRERLRLVVDGMTVTPPLSPEELSAVGIPIGTIAVDSTAPSREAAATLAKSLSLNGPAREGPMLVWTGQCVQRTDSSSR